MTLGYSTGGNTPSLQPCRVCAGAGKWDKTTGSPVFTAGLGVPITKCMWCGGTGKELR